MMDEPEDDFGPSKSERKRQAHDLQALGEALIALPQAEFDAMEMPDPLREAVALARRITAHGGLYRQKQYIGKLMRKIDAEPIRARLAARAAQHRVDTLRHQRAEQWRARLLAEGPAALDALLAEYPAADRPAIDRLVQAARTERERRQPPRAARELYAALRAVVGGTLLESGQ